MKKGTSQETKERVEAIEGMNIHDAVKRRYLTEKRSIRWLALHWRMNERTVCRIIDGCGISVRHGSDAVRAQWIGAAERRAKAGERLAQINHTLAQKGLHVRQGKTKKNSSLIRGVAEKLKVSSSFLRPDVRSKALCHSLETRALHPERMSALHAPLSECEEIMRAYLSSLGLAFEERKLVGRYVVNFFIPSINLIVDCQGRNRFPLSYVRHQAISQQGVSVCYCVNEQVKRRSFSHLDDYISRLKAFRADPSMRCAETVIFGACGQRPFGEDTAKFLIHKFGVRSDYLSEFTAATDD